MDFQAAIKRRLLKLKITKADLARMVDGKVKRTTAVFHASREPCAIGR